MLNRNPDEVVHKERKEGLGARMASDLLWGICYLCPLKQAWILSNNLILETYFAVP